MDRFVSVIIITFNNKDVLAETIDSLLKQTYPNFEIIVVDNNSTDGTSDLIKNKFPDVSYIKSDINLGFAGGNNLGLKQANGEYIALLNNDAVAQPEWLAALVEAMNKHDDVGVCASKMIAFGTKELDSAGDGYSTSLKGFKRGEGEDKGRYDTQEYVFGACAGAALYRRKMLDEIGFFDADFFLIHEDTDLNFRAQLSGWKVLYVPSAVVHHKVRSSIGHMSDIAVYYTVRNSDLVRIKNVPLPLFFRCLPEFIFGAVADFLSVAVKRRKLKQYLRAKADVVRSLGKTLSKRRDIMAEIRKVDDRYLLDIMSAIWSKSISETIRR